MSKQYSRFQIHCFDFLDLARAVNDAKCVETIGADTTRSAALAEEIDPESARWLLNAWQCLSNVHHRSSLAFSLGKVRFIDRTLTPTPHRAAWRPGRQPAWPLELIMTAVPLKLEVVAADLTVNTASRC